MRPYPEWLSNDCLLALIYFCSGVAGLRPIGAACELTMSTAFASMCATRCVQCRRASEAVGRPPAPLPEIGRWLCGSRATDKCRNSRGSHDLSRDAGRKKPLPSGRGVGHFSQSRPSSSDSTGSCSCVRPVQVTLASMNPFPFKSACKVAPRYLPSPSISAHDALLTPGRQPQTHTCSSVCQSVIVLQLG
jgi:hypothetical protein